MPDKDNLIEGPSPTVCLGLLFGQSHSHLYYEHVPCPLRRFSSALATISHVVALTFILSPHTVRVDTISKLMTQAIRISRVGRCAYMCMWVENNMSAAGEADMLKTKNLQRRQIQKPMKFPYLKATNELVLVMSKNLIFSNSGLNISKTPLLAFSHTNQRDSFFSRKLRKLGLVC